MYILLYASRAQKVEIDTTDSKAGKSVCVFCERPDTWVTVCTGHMGDTFSL
jgi:hypothetical protein